MEILIKQTLNQSNLTWPSTNIYRYPVLLVYSNPEFVLPQIYTPVSLLQVYNLGKWKLFTSIDIGWMFPSVILIQASTGARSGHSWVSCIAKNSTGHCFTLKPTMAAHKDQRIISKLLYFKLACFLFHVLLFYSRIL